MRRDLDLCSGVSEPDAGANRTGPEATDAWPARRHEHCLTEIQAVTAKTDETVSGEDHMLPSVIGTD